MAGLGDRSETLLAAAGVILATVAAWFPGSIIVFKVMEHFRLLQRRGERSTARYS